MNPSNLFSSLFGATKTRYVCTFPAYRCSFFFFRQSISDTFAAPCVYSGAFVIHVGAHSTRHRSGRPSHPVCPPENTHSHDNNTSRGCGRQFALHSSASNVHLSWGHTTLHHSSYFWSVFAQSIATPFPPFALLRVGSSTASPPVTTSSADRTVCPFPDTAPAAVS